MFTLNSHLTKQVAVSNSKTIVGGVVPREYIPSVEQGLKDAMENGVLAGYPLIDVKYLMVHTMMSIHQKLMVHTMMSIHQKWPSKLLHH